MRIALTIVTLFLLVACKSKDPYHFDLPNAERIDANIILNEFKSGSVACNQYEKATNSCVAVQELVKVTSGGIVVSFLTGKPFSYKVIKNSDLKLKENLLCTNFKKTNATQIGFSSIDAKAKISDFDKRAPMEKQKEVRNMVLEMTADEETCWAYYTAKVPSNGLAYEILMVTYIEGVRQPFKNSSRLTFFNQLGNLKLRKS